MKSSKLILILLIIFCLLQISCASKGLYVGESFNTDRWCKFISETGSCRHHDKNLIIVATIRKMEVEGEYLLEGFVDMHGLGAFAHVAAGHEDFYVLLARDNTVVNTVPFWLSGSEVHDKIPFNAKFKSPPFDSFAFIYKIRVEG